tara:strand:- start:86 stop:1276 length:1191 start_codon:yes stop_codon:yes gene_type:complete
MKDTEFNTQTYVKDKFVGAVVVDLLKSNGHFTEENLDTVKNLLDWKRIYPEVFGDKLPDPIYFSHFEILPFNLVDWSHQKYRVGGMIRKTKLVDIQQNIERNGFKLKYPAMAWFEWSPGSYDIITGNSRGQIVSSTPFNMKDGIIAIFKAKKGYTKAQIEDALSMCGLRFNSIHDPAEPLSKEDVKRNVTLAVQRYIDTNGEAGIPNTIEAIENRVDYVCGEGVFQPSTRQNLVFEIYNTFNPHDIIVPWSTKKEARYVISSFMKNVKFVDTDKVKYVPVAHDRERAAFDLATAKAVKFPDAEIRIVIHTSTLSGYDLETTYRDRINKFVTLFERLEANSCRAYFGKNVPPKSRIKIYGAFPAIGRIHDLENPLFFNSRTREFYQKDMDNSFSLSN